MCPGLRVFTRMRFGPSSQAMLRPIWSTADFDVLYDTQAWSCSASEKGAVRRGAAALASTKTAISSQHSAFDGSTLRKHAAEMDAWPLGRNTRMQ